MYFVEKTREFVFFKRFDYIAFVPVLLLCMIGLFLVRSAVLSRSDGGFRIMLMQIVGFCIGMFLCFIISWSDYKDLKTLAYVFYSFSIVLLVVVLVNGTGDIYGSRSWLNIGGISFQPSEITKITFIIILAVYLEKLTEEGTNKGKNILKLAFFSLFPIILIIIQKDYGTALVFAFILIMMMFAYGVRFRYFLISSAVCILASPLAWMVLNDKRKDRIKVFLNPEMDPLGSGLNVIRSKIAIGSGQLFGKGLFQGPQTQNSAVPVKESDFIFSVIGEELGFVGALAVILLVMIIILRFTYIALNARDSFGAFLIIGVCAMLSIHFIENIGMTIGLFPVTGIPFPFVSAGGSSMVSSLISVGIVLSVSMRKKKVIFQQ